jgi:hypothetical protein
VPRDEFEFSDGTQRLDTAASVSALRDIVRGSFGSVGRDRLMGSIRALHERSMNKTQLSSATRPLPEHLQKAVADGFESEDVINLPEEETAWPASNAISSVARHAEHPELNCRECLVKEHEELVGACRVTSRSPAEHSRKVRQIAPARSIRQSARPSTQVGPSGAWIPAKPNPNTLSHTFAHALRHERQSIAVWRGPCDSGNALAKHFVERLRRSPNRPNLPASSLVGPHPRVLLCVVADVDSRQGQAKGDGRT